MKQKKNLKLNVSKNIVLPLAVFVSFCGAFVCSGPQTSNLVQNLEIPAETPSEYVPVYPLPTQQVIKERLSKIYSDERKMFFIASDWNGGIKRMPCKQNEPIKINVCFDANTIAHVAIDSAVAELNNLFSVVNPNYVFKVEYSPTQADTNDVFNVELFTVEKLNGTALAVTYVHPREYYLQEIDGYEVFNSYIEIKSSELDKNVVKLKVITLHELCHCLGLGDAYDNPYATSETIMQAWTARNHDYAGLEEIDVATLAALYYDGTTDPKELAEFVSNYRTTERDFSQAKELNKKCGQFATENVRSQSIKNFVSKIEKEREV